MPIGQIWTHKRQGKVGHWWIFSLFTSKWTSQQFLEYLYPVPQDWTIICTYSRNSNVHLHHIGSPAFPASVPTSFSSASLRLDYRCGGDWTKQRWWRRPVIYLCSEPKLKQCLSMASIISIFSLCMFISISLFLFNLDLKLTTSINLSIKTSQEIRRLFSFEKKCNFLVLYIICCLQNSNRLKACPSHRYFEKLKDVVTEEVRSSK